MLISRCLAGCVLLLSGVLATNDTSDPSKDTVKVTTLAPPIEDEQTASVEQVPPPAPLITESAHKGYRMPGLYGMGSQPFYLELDPVTGNVDFSNPSSPQTDNNHRYSSKVSQEATPLSDQEYDYEEVAIKDDDTDPIDRKDTLGPNRPNDIKPYQQDFSPYFQSNNFREKIPPKEKFPLISSSYANTKVQGMGIVKQEPQKPISISTPPPSYFTFKPAVTSTTEKILDFWPLKSTTAAPTAPEHYDYYDETPTMQEEEIEEDENTAINSLPPTTTTKMPPTTAQSVVYSVPFVPTATPTDEYQTTVPTKQSPIPTLKPITISQPYGFEEPFRPIYGPGEGEEEPIDRPDAFQEENRPLPPSIYNLPPKNDHKLVRPGLPSQRPDVYVQSSEDRPIQSGSFNNQPIDIRPSIFNPPPVPIYNQQPGPQRRPISPPSIRPMPPKYEPSKFQLESDDDESTQPPTIRAPQIDSQGWKQATFTQTPSSASSTNRGQFADDDLGEETYTPSPRPNPTTFKQPIPQGYEPHRPLPVQFRPQPNSPRPSQDSDVGLRPPNEGQVRPGFDGPRPQFDRPKPDGPMRNQFDGRPIFGGSMRVPLTDGQIRPPFDGPLIRQPQQQMPLRRWERPPGSHFPSVPPHAYQDNKFNNMRVKSPQQAQVSMKNDPKLPNILPQFRPNARISFQVDGKPPQRSAGPMPPMNRRQTGFMERLYPPPPPQPYKIGVHQTQHVDDNFSSPPPFQNSPPLVGRRVGSQVSTLQMMQHGVLPRPSSREDAPHPNPRPPVTPYEVRPAKYGTLQQGSEEKPVFVVYANSGESQQPPGDVLIGTHGPHKPLPPSHLTDEEPVLNNKRPQVPAKAEFPYALEKPAEEVKKYVHTEEIDKDEEINIIPNLQDYMPFAIKSTSTKSQSSVPSATLTTPLNKIAPEVVITEVKPTIQSFIRPQSNSNEFTVSAVMHTGNHPGAQGMASVMVVPPQHRNPVQETSQTSSSALPESYNFQAPFHASANVAPSPGNGWSAVKGAASKEQETLRPGLVDRADVAEEMVVAQVNTANSNTKFDIENFKPELIGGFQPLYSFPTATSATSSVEEKQTTSEREEKMI